MFESRSTDELVNILSAGGGFRFNASPRSTNELVLLAGAAARGKAKLILAGLTIRTTDELVSIAAAGQGNVSFE